MPGSWWQLPAGLFWTTVASLLLPENVLRASSAVHSSFLARTQLLYSSLHFARAHNRVEGVSGRSGTRVVTDVPFQKVLEGSDHCVLGPGRFPCPTLVRLVQYFLGTCAAPSPSTIDNTLALPLHTSSGLPRFHVLHMLVLGVDLLIRLSPASPGETVLPNLSGH